MTLSAAAPCSPEFIWQESRHYKYNIHIEIAQVFDCLKIAQYRELVSNTNRALAGISDKEMC